MQLHSMLASAVAARRVLAARAGTEPSPTPAATEPTRPSALTQQMSVLRVLARDHPETGVSAELVLVLRLARHQSAGASAEELCALLSHAHLRHEALRAPTLAAEVCVRVAPAPAAVAAAAALSRSEEPALRRLGSAMGWLHALHAASSEQGVWSPEVLEAVVSAGLPLPREAWEVYLALVPDLLSQVAGRPRPVPRAQLCELAEVCVAATSLE